MRQQALPERVGRLEVPFYKGFSSISALSMVMGVVIACRPHLHRQLRKRLQMHIHMYVCTRVHTYRRTPIVGSWGPGITVKSMMGDRIDDYVQEVHPSPVPPQRIRSQPPMFIRSAGVLTV